MLYSEYCKSVPGTGSAAQCFGPDTAVVSCILLANMSDRWHVPEKNMSGFTYEKYLHLEVLWHRTWHASALLTVGFSLLSISGVYLVFASKQPWKNVWNILWQKAKYYYLIFSQMCLLENKSSVLPDTLPAFSQMIHTIIHIITNMSTKLFTSIRLTIFTIDWDGSLYIKTD